MGYEVPAEASRALALAGGVFAVLAILHFAVSYTIYSIAKRTGAGNAWLAFVPVANLYLLGVAGGQSPLVFLLCFVPGVNIVGFALIGLGLARARGKPDWVGLAFALPVVNLFVLGYLAFGD